MKIRKLFEELCGNIRVMYAEREPGNSPGTCYLNIYINMVEMPHTINLRFFLITTPYLITTAFITSYTFFYLS
jgi:hypothetical protein